MAEIFETTPLRNKLTVVAPEWAKLVEGPPTIPALPARVHVRLYTVLTLHRTLNRVTSCPAKDADGKVCNVQYNVD